MMDHEHIRRAYDAVAEDYAEFLRDELAGKPLDRALLTVFAERVAATGSSRVIDAGCGPGRIAGHLSGLGVDVSGVDLSPAMIAIARRAHPGVDFKVGSIDSLDAADASRGGVLAWYSIIHTAPEHLAAVFAEFSRVVVPGGWLLVAFQIGGERVRLERPYGHDVELDAIRHDVGVVEEALDATGFAVESRTVREPVPPERVRQAYLFAQRAW